MLLILDNCEHVIADVSDIVSELVSASGQLNVLATSRAPMMITAESVYPLPPLDIDESGSPATDLFRARAKAVRPSARLDQVEIARLCRTLDGLPLAIELAAARVRTMSVDEINTRLSDRFALLRTGDRTSPQRHRTLHAVIDWSWNLLDGPQQAALRRLCRFPSGFTLDAAALVAEWGVVDDIGAALEGLVNQSMLAVVENDEPIGLRYHMLETVREFGEEQLVGADEADEVMTRMSHWAQDLALAMSEGFIGDREVATVYLVEAEHDNLLAVLRHAIARRDAKTVYLVFPILGFHWAMRGAHSEVFSWGPRILDIDPRGPGEADIPADFLVVAYMLAGMHMILGGDVRAIALARCRIRVPCRTRTDIRGVLRMNAAVILTPLSGKGLARTLAEGARSADELTRVSALSARANFRENFGDVFGSMRDGERALDLNHGGGDTWTRAMLFSHLGSLYGQTAQYAESVEYYRRAAESMWNLHAYEESAQIRAFMGTSLIGAGRIEEGRRELSSLLGSSDADPVIAPSAWGEGNQRVAAVHAGLAEADLFEGDVDGGVRRYRRALDVCGWPSMGQAPGPYEVLIASAVVSAYILYGRCDDAAALVTELTRQAVERLGRLFDLPQIGCVANAVGSYEIATGRDPEHGLALLALALPVRARQDYPSMVVARHIEAARSVLGDQIVDEELTRAAKVPRRAAAEAILDHLRR